MISGCCFETGVNTGYQELFRFPFEPKVLISGDYNVFNDKSFPNLCGIYGISGLYKSETVKTPFYIGSSNDIERRFIKNHIPELNSSGHCNPVLQAAWDKHGQESFVFFLLEECSEENQFPLEQGYLDNLRPFVDERGGYNISHFAVGGNGYPGDPFVLRSPSGEIIEGVNLKKFARENGLEFPAIQKITTGKNQNSKGWTCPKYTFEKKARKNAKKDKKPKASTKKIREILSPNGELLTFNSFRSFCAKYKVGRKGLRDLYDEKIIHYGGWSLPKSNYVHEDKQYEIESPTGQIYKFKKFREFGRLHNLPHSSISSVIKGEIDSCKGWKLPGKIIPKKIFKIKSPNNEICEIENLSKFARENGLNRGCLKDIVKGRSKTHKGWSNKDHTPIQKIYKITSPSGETYSFNKISDFAKEHGLTTTGISNLLSDRTKHHKGWTQYNSSYQKPIYKLINPAGELVIFENIRQFCRERPRLGRHYINMLLKEEINNYHGYTKYKE